VFLFRETGAQDFHLQLLASAHALPPDIYGSRKAGRIEHVIHARICFAHASRRAPRHALPAKEHARGGKNNETMPRTTWPIGFCLNKKKGKKGA
jgi:hypothetical protein